MTLNEFNDADPAVLKPLLLSYAAIPAWADDLMAARPFDTLASLLAVAEQLTLGWQPQQVASALSHHPRIGETAAGDDAAADHARREQPSLTDHDGALKRALLAGNRQYEARFQHIFLIRAAGRGAEEILACLRRRLNNTDEQEQLATTEQLREITLLRLRQGFAP